MVDTLSGTIGPNFCQYVSGYLKEIDKKKPTSFTLCLIFSLLRTPVTVTERMTDSVDVPLVSWIILELFLYNLPTHYNHFSLLILSLSLYFSYILFLILTEPGKSQTYSFSEVSGIPCSSVSHMSDYGHYYWTPMIHWYHWVRDTSSLSQ